MFISNLHVRIRAILDEIIGRAYNKYFCSVMYVRKGNLNTRGYKYPRYIII